VIPIFTLTEWCALTEFPRPKVHSPLSPNLGSLSHAVHSVHPYTGQDSVCNIPGTVGVCLRNSEPPCLLSGSPVCKRVNVCLNVSFELLTLTVRERLCGGGRVGGGGVCIRKRHTHARAHTDRHHAQGWSTPSLPPTHPPTHTKHRGTSKRS